MSQTSSANYLHPDLLATVSSIELRARMIVEGLMTGMHRSPMQGFSVEFAQHRQYTPGDDTRFLDWKVFGKTDKLYLKQYQKETNLDLALLVDVSGSMGYASGGRSRGAEGPRGQGTEERGRGAKGPRGQGKDAESGSSAFHSAPRPPGPSAPMPWRKYDHAATVAAAMGYLALKQQDRVGLTLFADTVRHATRLSSNQGHWRAITEALGSVSFSDSPVEPAQQGDGDAKPGTDFASLFDRTAARLTQRSMIVLISDLFDDPAALERGLAKLYHRRHDVIVLQTLDPAERTFPFRSPSDFLGLEAEGRLPLDPMALRKGYLEALEAHLHAIEQMTRKYHFDYLLVDTSESLGPVLSQFLAHRAARIARR